MGVVGVEMALKAVRLDAVTPGAWSPLEPTCVHVLLSLACQAQGALDDSSPPAFFFFCKSVSLVLPLSTPPHLKAVSA